MLQPVEPTDDCGREEAGRQRAPRPADAVYTDDVERVVQARHRAQPDGAEADDAGDGADRDRFHRLHVAGRRRDRDQSRDAPAAAPTTLGLPVIHQLTRTQPSTAAAAAVFVTTKALTA